MRTGSPVLDVRRDPFGVTVTTAARGRERFDSVILATHADDALRLLGDADPHERRVLGGFEYSTNAVVLHTDDRAPAGQPPRPRIVERQTADCRRPGDALSMTYHMNRLQSLPGAVEYCVSVNPGDAVRRRPRPRRARVRHPMYTFRTLRAQAGVRDLQGRNRTWFAGAHLGYGFHEDGCRSGYEAADMVRGAVAQVAA